VVRNRLAEHLVAGVLAVLMLLWLWQATRLPYTVAGRPGPGFFPVWLSAIGLVLSIAVLVTGIRAPRPTRSDGEPASPEPDDAQVDDSGSRWAGTVRLVGALLGAIAFLVLMPMLGFAVGLALYLAYLCLVIMRMRVASALALSLGTSAVIYLVFDQLLAVPFPTGMVGI
jgi:putative tricarboxylic transport membrane protein